jgi:seryl-tRNA synthetase
VLNINLVRKDPELVKQSVKKRHKDFDVNLLLKLDRKKRDLLAKVEELRHEQNEISEKIAKSKGKEKQRMILEMRGLSNRLKESEPKLKKIEAKVDEMMLELSNIPKDDVPVGKDESENKVAKVVGSPTRFGFRSKDHVEIGERLDLIDVKRAAKVSGSRFGYLKNEAVSLEFALVKFAFDILVKEGFVPVIPPVIIKEKAMQGLGYLSGGGEEDTYHFTKDKQYFIGTSEQSVIPMHMNEILPEDELPKRYVAFSTCFRREAGSYGKDTRGILRVHQFDKVEMISITKPEASDKEQEYLLSLQERLVSSFKLPYRIMQVCTGDLSYQSARTLDLECWIPSQDKYRETHSLSNCTDFQARRLNIRYKDKKTKKNEFVHTLNGTAFAIGRTIIAILENCQKKDSSVEIPQVLRPYMNNLTMIKKIE